MVDSFFHDRTIWLIGGSRGMGLALAAELINRGAAVVISARKRPQHLAHDSYLFKPLDVSNLDALITTAKKLKPLDGVIYMPAVYTPSAIANIKQQPLRDLLTVNSMAPTLLATTLASHLEQRRGFIAIAGSQAGDVGLPLGQPYSASKAYLKNFCQSLAVEYPRLGVHLIAPGFVETDLTASNQFAMPFIMSPEDAARAIVRGLKKKKSVIIFPYRLRLLLLFWHWLPLWLKKRLWAR